MFKKFFNAIAGLFKRKTVLEKSVSKVKSCEEGGVCPIVDPIYPNKAMRGLLWYPNAVQGPRMKAQGRLKEGYPVGAIVHFTAGRGGGLERAITEISAAAQKYNFLCIADTGEIVQPNPLNEWGYHAGESAWKFSKLFSGSVSDETIGIEMNNAGIVEKVGENRFKTWFGTYLTADQVRYVTEKTYGCPTGYYHKYTDAQEKTLIEFLVWLIKNDPTERMSYETILGHHEVAGKLGLGRWRKNDPGGALSMTMPQLRQVIKELTV